MTPTLQYRTAQVLDDAATLIETKGWCRGKYEDGDRHCTLGALRAVSPRDRHGYFDDVYYVAYDAVAAEVRLQSNDGIGGWNDAQRDRRKVVRTLRRTARKVRRGQIIVPAW